MKYREFGDNRSDTNIVEILEDNYFLDNIKNFKDLLGMIENEFPTLVGKEVKVK